MAPTLWWVRVLIGFCIAVGLFAGIGPAFAGSLIYTPTNPSFGGSPINGPNLLNLANAQNLPLAHKTNMNAAISRASSSSSSSSSTSASQLFARQLQSQLLSSFANQITQAIFGENAQTSGHYSFGDTTIDFVHAGSNVEITIFDGTSSTTISVPAL
jgi:curli production assembly/transport component CsgF